MKLLAWWRQTRAEQRERKSAYEAAFQAAVEAAYEALNEPPDTGGIYSRESKVRRDYSTERRAKEAYLRKVGLSYEQYLATAGWRERRGAAIDRANGRCENCDDHLHAGRTDVHHLTYTSMGREPPEHLMVLCRDCHEVHHGYRSLEEVILQRVERGLAPWPAAWDVAGAETPDHGYPRRPQLFADLSPQQPPFWDADLADLSPQQPPFWDADLEDD
jgi:5-methylcytosine-specific restriction endonuclease McrA